MATIVIPYTFSAGATIIAAEHNSNFSTIYDEFNGNISNANINSSSAIAYSKLAIAGSVTNADIVASAGIPYSKLTVTGSITNADIVASAGIPYSKITVVSSITNADVSSSASLATSKLEIPVRTSSIIFRIDGGGSAPSTGVAGDVEIPFACTITQTALLADQAGAITIDVWKDTYANYPPTDADSITSQTPLTITTGTNKSQDVLLTGWTRAISAGDTLRFNVDSVGTITACTINIRVIRN